MLAGSLTEFSIPDIFSLLAATRKTGVLNLTGSDSSGRVWIIGGALAYAVADVSRTPLAARLLHGGEIDLDTVEPLVRAQAAGEGDQISEVLAAAGIHIDRVHQLLHDQVVDAVFDLSRWADGTFAFDADPSAAQSTAPAIPATEVLEAVAARIAEWEGIVAQLPSPASVLAPVSRPPLQSGGLVQLTAAQWEVFTLADGLRSVSDIIALTGQGQFVVARLLASLVADGVLAVADRSGEQTLSQQRAAHLARLEQQVLGAAARGGGAANGRAGMVSQEAQASAVQQGINGHHAESQQSDDDRAQDDRAQDDRAQDDGAQDDGAQDDGAQDDRAQDHGTQDDRAQDETAPDPANQVDGGQDTTIDVDRAEDTAVQVDGPPDDGPLDVAAMISPARDSAASQASQAAEDKPDRPDAAEQRRIREMAALGIGPAQDDSDPTADATEAEPQGETKSLGTDLLSRLIDGVKGA